MGPSYDEAPRFPTGLEASLTLVCALREGSGERDTPFAEALETTRVQVLSIPAPCRWDLASLSGLGAALCFASPYGLLALPRRKGSALRWQMGRLRHSRRTLKYIHFSPKSSTLFFFCIGPFLSTFKHPQVSAIFKKSSLNYFLSHDHPVPPTALS